MNRLKKEFEIYRILYTILKIILDIKYTIVIRI